MKHTWAVIGVAAALAALDDVGRGDGDDRGHRLLGDVGEGRQTDAGAGVGGGRHLALGLGARRDVHGARHDHAENDGRGAGYVSAGRTAALDSDTDSHDAVAAAATR